MICHVHIQTVWDVVFLSNIVLLLYYHSLYFSAIFAFASETKSTIQRFLISLFTVCFTFCLIYLLFVQANSSIAHLLNKKEEHKFPESSEVFYQPSVFI